MKPSAADLASEWPDRKPSGDNCIDLDRLHALAPPSTDAQRAAALRVLTRYDALDLAAPLGLTHEGEPR